MISKSNFSRNKARFLARLAASGTDVILTWETLTGTTVDAETGAIFGTPTVHTETVKGFIHFPEVSARSVDHFAEIETGDCIVDVHPDTTIEGRQNLTFTISGEVWVQKKIGTRLAKAWDVIFENSRFCRTLLLRKAT